MFIQFVTEQFVIPENQLPVRIFLTLSFISSQYDAFNPPIEHEAALFISFPEIYLIHAAIFNREKKWNTRIFSNPIVFVQVLAILHLFFSRERSEKKRSEIGLFFISRGIKIIGI